MPASFVSSYLFLLLISSVCSTLENAGVNTKIFSEKSDIVTEDPKYKELQKEVTELVSNAVANFTVETGKVVNGVISRIDIAYNNLGTDDYKTEARSKLMELKEKTLKGFGICPHRENIEKGTWAIAIQASLITQEIHNASQDSLNFCMMKNKSHNVVCRSNPEDEVSKRFDSLKQKVKELADLISKLYTNELIPFLTKCYDEESLDSTINSIVAGCPMT